MDIDQDNLDIEGSRIGNNNIVESRARIVGSTSVGNYCVIGSGCSTESNETIPDLTIIYGFQSKRRNQSEPLAVTYIAPYFFFFFFKKFINLYNIHIDSSNTSCETFRLFT